MASRTQRARQIASYVGAGIIPVQGGGAASYASFSAPSGYFWDFITEGGARITEANVPVVSLEKAA